jgi:hypothetical protein
VEAISSAVTISCLNSKELSNEPLAPFLREAQLADIDLELVLAAELQSSEELATEDTSTLGDARS